MRPARRRRFAPRYGCCRISPEAAVNLGIALQRLGDLPAALDAYRDGLRIRPDTLGRIAQALTAAGTGMLVLDPAALRRMLGA